MAYTVTRLITEAYYLSGRLSRGLNTISGPLLQIGLVLLNAVLSIKSANERLIPYFTEYDDDFVVGQEKYFIENLISIETMTFEYNTVRWSMQPSTRRPYQGSSRAENINSLPQNYYCERAKGGANVFVYFFPDSTYPFKIWGKFSLLNVVLNQDLESTLDKFYIEYLRYALAEYICQDNNITFQPQNSETLQEYEKIITDVAVPDLTIAKITAFNPRPTYNWGDVNLGHGWRPG